MSKIDSTASDATNISDAPRMLRGLQIAAVMRVRQDGDS